MDAKFPAIATTRKTGNERFCCGNAEEEFTLLDFWQWAASDLVGNTNRGRLAEYIVARALGLGANDVRNEWDVVDLLTADGVKVEVKSAAYVQRWFQKKLSEISFVVPPRRGWEASTGVLEPISRRHADVYVFALLAHQDQASINPLDLAQWQFFVVPTAFLNRRERSQHSITFKSLIELSKSRVELGSQPVAFPSLREAVATAARIQSQQITQPG
jgi:hypothetical protein